MGRIKTRENAGGSKAPDKSAVVGQRMKNAFIRSKRNAAALMDDRQATPSEYAEDNVQFAAGELTHDTANVAVSGTKSVVRQGRKLFQNQREKRAEENHREDATPTEQPPSPGPSPGTAPEGQPTQRRADLSAGGQLSQQHTDPIQDRRLPRQRREPPMDGRLSQRCEDPIPDRRLPRERTNPPVGGQIPRQYTKASQDRRLPRQRTASPTDGQFPQQYADPIPDRRLPRQRTGTAPATQYRSLPENKQPSAHADIERPADTANPIAERGRGFAKERGEKRAERKRRAKNPTIQPARPQQIIFQGVTKAPRQTEPIDKAVEVPVKTVKRSAQAVRQTEKDTGRAAKGVVRTVKRTVKTAQRTAKGTVKTAQRTTKTAIKTADHAAKAAQKTAQAAAKTAKMTAQAARAAAKSAATAAKATAKAIATAVKAIIAAVRALIAAIAAGGWVAILAIVIICLIGLIVASPFGIFFAGDNTDADTVPVSVAVSQIIFDFNSQLETLQAGEYDNIDVTGSMADWPEVLAVFAVKVAGREDADVMDVVTMDPTRVAKLKEVFWDMNALTSTVETVDHPDSNPDDDTDDSWTERILHITITAKTAEDMKTEYRFTEKQKTILDELLENRDALLDVIGELMFISADAEAVIRNLPSDLSDERRAVVRTACSLVGKVTYFWGGKSLVIGWDSRWGTIQKVWADGSETTGTYRPYGLDCSGFVDWVFYNATDGAYYPGHGGGAASQHGYCTPISWDEAIPGDLVFYPEDSHVGIVAGWDEAGNLLIVHCASGINNVVITDSAGFTSIGRPLYYSE